MNNKEFLINCADIADDIAMHYYQNVATKVNQKSDLSPVTQADQEIEKKIRDMVAIFNKEMEVYGEEFGICPENTPLKLIIDPIDGTRNFVRGIPFFATLLAIEENGEVIDGVISAPAKKDRWQATKGQGAFYNNNPIKVSTISDLTKAQAFHGSLYGNEADMFPQEFFTLLSKTARQRGVGDYYQHMLVAMGAGEFAMDFGIKPWDIAPLAVILKEAGGAITNPDGKLDIYKSNIVSSNSFLHSEILSILG